MRSNCTSSVSSWPALFDSIKNMLVLSQSIVIWLPWKRSLLSVLICQIFLLHDPTIVDLFNELPKLFLFGWNINILDYFNFLVCGHYALTNYPITKEFKLWLSKERLLWLNMSPASWILSNTFSIMFRWSSNIDAVMHKQLLM